MKAFKINPESKFHQEMSEVFNVKERWNDAVKDIGVLLGIPDFDQAAVTTHKLYITSLEVDKIENGSKLFKSEKGFYTPKMSTKKGKEWAAGFKEIVKKHRLDVPDFGTLMFIYGMNNRSYEKPYRNMKAFQIDGVNYVSWEGYGEPKVSGMDEISSREYYDALVRFEEQDKEKVPANE